MEPTNGGGSEMDPTPNQKPTIITVRKAGKLPTYEGCCLSCGCEVICDCAGAVPCPTAGCDDVIDVRLPKTKYLTADLQERPIKYGD